MVTICLASGFHTRVFARGGGGGGVSDTPHHIHVHKIFNNEVMGGGGDKY